MTQTKITVLQLICPLGFYGAERWVVALGNNSDPAAIDCHLAVTEEGGGQNLDIVEVYPDDRYLTFKLPMSSSFDLKVIAKLVRVIKENGVEIVHTHGYKSDILGFIAAKWAGIRVISTPHGFGVPSSRKLHYFIELGKFFLKYMDAVVPLSRQLEREVKEVGVKESKITYIQNGVDLTEIDEFIVDHDARQALRTQQDSKSLVVGFVGQMIPRKNIKDLLDIFELCWRKNHQLELKLLGDGESRQELERYASTLDSSENIHFLGFRSDRLDIMKTFDLFAMTSRDEGIPRCLMEAMAMKLPVAAYDISGIDQLVTHQQTGLLAPFGDTEALAEHWQKILYEHDVSKALGNHARDFVLSNFSAKRMADEYAELYSEILGRA